MLALHIIAVSEETLPQGYHGSEDKCSLVSTTEHPTVDAVVAGKQNCSFILRPAVIVKASSIVGFWFSSRFCVYTENKNMTKTAT